MEVGLAPASGHPVTEAMVGSAYETCAQSSITNSAREPIKKRPHKLPRGYHVDRRAELPLRGHHHRLIQTRAARIGKTADTA